MGEATGQQKLFIDEYLKGRKSNAKQAAILAGYSKKSASSQSSQLLSNPNVSEYLKQKEELISQQLQADFLFDALEARSVMYKILKNAKARDTDKIAVAKDFLDRAGFKATEKIDVGVKGEVVVNFSIPRPGNNNGK